MGPLQKSKVINRKRSAGERSEAAKDREWTYRRFAGLQGADREQKPRNQAVTAWNASGGLQQQVEGSQPGNDRQHREGHAKAHKAGLRERGVRGSREAYA